MLRTKGEAGTGNVVEAVRHARAVQREIRRLTAMDEDELFVYAKDIRVRIHAWMDVCMNGWMCKRMPSITHYPLKYLPVCVCVRFRIHTATPTN